MQPTLKLLPWAAALAALTIAAAARAEGVEFHGYMRTGAGTTTEGGNLQCFQGGWPVRAKYRLGNECDSYGEAGVVLPFGDSNGPWAKYHLLLALQDKASQDYDSISGDKFDLMHRENYIEMGGVFGEGNFLENAKAWVGKRFYNRHDIHINDYYYWNNSGVGAGMEEMAAGPVKLSYAYFQTGGNANDPDAVVGKRHALRFYDIDLLGGKLEGEAVFLKGSTTGDGQIGHGQQLFLEHTQSGILGGFNKVAVIWGKKLGAGFEWLPSSQGAAPAEGRSWRVHDHLSFAIKGTGWTGLATASYGMANFGNGAKDNTWVSFGIRPQYNFTPYFSVAAEVGHDHGENSDGGKPRLTKFTLAPQLALSPGVWARPVLRAFVTHATWNADAGTQANGVFGDKKSGTTYGVQAEAWW